MMRTMRVLFVLMALVATCGGLRHLLSQPNAIPLSKIKVDNSLAGNPLVDEGGRVRVFHGINKVRKSFPWYPADLLNTTHLDQLSSWGFNVVRLGTMWSGVEVGPFKVNQTYLNTLDTIISSLAKRGVYVILDMHQDGLSSKFDNYDGAPLWLINSLPAPREPFPSPFSKPPTNWELNYVTIACGEAFQNIYLNKSQALDHLGFFWHTVAKRFGHYDNVLGYEIMNEPWPGDVYADPTLFIPGRAGSHVLQPLYDAIAPFIRSVDERSLIFYEPVTWGMILHNEYLGTGFTHVPGGDNYRNRSVLSFHYYCWAAGSDVKTPFPFWLRVLCDDLFFPEVLSSTSADVAQTGGARFLTEFGLCQATAPHNSTEYQECLSVLNTGEAAMLSWTYWDDVFYTPSGAPVLENVKLFSRTYTMAVAGVPTDSKFDSDTGSYTLVFTPSKGGQAPTVIYVSRIHYPTGFVVQAVNANFTVVNTCYVEVVPSTQSLQPVTVKVTRK